MQRLIFILLFFSFIFISCYRDDLSSYNDQEVDVMNSDTVNIERIKIKTH